jgi:flagellar hook-length control protein FliK
VPPDYDLALDAALPTDAIANDNALAAPSGGATLALVAQAATGSNVGSNPSSNADSNTNNAQAQTEQRAEQFQHMANQMGQAAAQRLIAQIERGQWKLQMRMQPAALGSIHVELDMHAGGLDALFSADSAVTRELMVQGHHKLRDTLADAGMTVASITVNGDQSRQSGGNSTPGKGRASALGKGSVGGASASAMPAAPTDGATQTDGLNVLA